MDNENVIKERQEKIISFLRQKYDWIVYIILAGIVFLSVKIRTKNIPGLKDVTTGSWTLGPDLDPFLFLRWSKYIVENGTLFMVDKMRYFPRGYDVGEELLLHPYMMAWFHNIISFLGISDSITYSAIIYPVFFFAITIIAFFLFTRKIFAGRLGEKKANAIALIASLLLTLSPLPLPRTIAGIPEKESAAFFFMFMAFYLFLSAWHSKAKYGRYVWAAFAGIATAGMAFVWGGFGYIFLTIGLSTLIAFLLDKVDLDKVKIYFTWVVASMILMVPSERYILKEFIISVSFSPIFFVILSSLVLVVIRKERIKEKLKLKRFSKIPSPLISGILTGVIGGLLATVLLGFERMKGLFAIISSNLTTPAKSRLIQTVAENRQPYFTEWANNFGPKIGSLHLFLWLFLIGSVFLFYYSISHFKKKEKIILTSSYVLFLISIIFSRYSGGHILNGENGTSLLFYAVGPLILLIFFALYYFRDYKETGLERFRKIPYGAIFVLSLLFFGLVSARAAVRLVMILAVPASILAGYFVVITFDNARKKAEKNKAVYWAVFLIVLIVTAYSGYYFYLQSSSTAQNFVPTAYNQQWQKSMDWVRENTPENAVFGHWWDYGYWIQSLGERATILDGGNAMSYWNHLMGRYGLTSPSSRDSAEFLYAHNTTHFLIDSTDIGKYSAYSFIGSNPDFDRRSYIPSFIVDDAQTRETKNSTVVLYRGGFGLDEDIIYEVEGGKIFLPANSAGLGGILLERTPENKIITPPIGIFVYQGRQYNIPIRYAYQGGELVDFGSGINASIFLYPYAYDTGNGLDIKFDGALFYLSERTYKSQVARLYLYGEENPYFTLAHKQDDFLVEQIKMNYPGYDSDFVYYGGFRGPIKIWEVKYPGIEFKEEYLEIEYPEELQFT